MFYTKFLSRKKLNINPDYYERAKEKCQKCVTNSDIYIHEIRNSI